MGPARPHRLLLAALLALAACAGAGRPGTPDVPGDPAPDPAPDVAADPSPADAPGPDPADLPGPPDLPGPSDAGGDGADVLRPTWGGWSAELSDGWRLQSSAVAAEPGDVLSTRGLDDAEWFPARVPSTLAGALREAGWWDFDESVGLAFRQVPGIEDGQGGAAYPPNVNFVDMPIPAWSPFAVSWWYRTEFAMPPLMPGQRAWLALDGVSYRADVWLNGVQVGSRDRVVGTYRAFELDVTDAVDPHGANALAIGVFPQDVLDLGHSWVDWNPTPPDKDAGLWRPVRVATSGPVHLRHPFVQSFFPNVRNPARPHLSEAMLTLSVEAVNGSAAPVPATVRFDVALADGRVIAVDWTGEIPPGSTELVVDAGDSADLVVADPPVWWPAGLGAQALGSLKVSAWTGTGGPDGGGDLSDLQTTRFGIREVQAVLGSDGRSDDGTAVFLVNGVPVLVRGAGWAREMMLMETPAREAREVALVKEMGLNAVRFEGKFASDHLMDLLDEAGILVIAGWCCCDAWERSWMWGGDDTSEAWTVALESLRSQALSLRNHPSVLSFWYGSDYPPEPPVEQAYLDVLAGTRWPAAHQSSASEAPTDAAGPTGLKMNGPYEWVPPSYWLADTTAGGAWSFSTEVGPGPSIPGLPSLARMLGQEHLSWPLDAESEAAWTFHCGGGAFQDTTVHDAALAARYGAPRGDNGGLRMQDYVRKAQLSAYEAHRAMFEAYGRNKWRASGVIQWMLNNAWPSLIWHLYDFYLSAGGAYFGTKTALRPLHVQYDHDTRTVTVVNSLPRAFQDVAVRARAYDLSDPLRPAWQASATVDVPADAFGWVEGLSAGVARVPMDALPAALPGLTSATFLLRLDLSADDPGGGGARTDHNLYWLSTSEDVMDWAAQDWYVTPTKAFADLSGLQDLPAPEPYLLAPGALPPDPADGKLVVEWRELSAGEVAATGRPGDAGLRVTLQNRSDRLAFFTHLVAWEADPVNRSMMPREVVPAYWSDNFVTVWPAGDPDGGDVQSVDVTWHAADRRPGWFTWLQAQTFPPR